MSSQGKLIEQLFYVYHDTLKKYCMHCFHYQSQYMPYVDDCIQEVFIAALRKEKKLASHPNPYAWLANACRKQCATILRQKAVRARITGQQVPFEDKMQNACVQDDIVRWIDAYEAKQSLFTLRSQLTELECFVFKEYFLQQRQASEIAEERHISVTAVYGAIQRIRKKACRFLVLAIFFSIGSLISFTHAVML